MEHNEQANPGVNDLIEEFAQRGLTPQQLAAVVKGLAGRDQPMSGSDNFPGFEFSQRVATAAVRALAGHARELNANWASIRRGQFSVSEALQSWSRITEAYFGVVTEAVRSSDVSQPTWQVIPYSKKGHPQPRHSIRIDRVLAAGTALASTAFEGLGTGRSTQDFYKKKPTLEGNRVEFTLDKTVLDSLKDGTDYVSFVFPKAMGTVPPLVIILLSITA
jgi:hypothetical protein